MPDHDFYFTDKARGYPAAVERRAVFDSLYSGSRGRSTSDDCRQAQDVINRWRAKVNQLRSLDCSGVRGPRGQWVRNCPPTGVVRGEKRQLRSCNLDRVCPWCFARAHAVGIYKTLERALFLDTPARGKYKLLLRSETLAVEKGRSYFYALSYGRGLVDMLYKLNQPGSVGFASLIALYPRKDRWCASVRLLSVVPEDWQAGDRWKASKPILLKKQLIPYAARFGSYPAGLLAGDGAMLAQYLDSELPVKLKSCFGLLTKRTFNGRASKFKEEGDGPGGV